MPVWSCIWNADDHNLFYAGMQNGTVLEFDTRNTASHVQELNMEGSRSPVRALQYVPQDARAMFRLVHQSVPFMPPLKGDGI